VDVDLVLVTATVTTRDGRLVNGLARENFQVIEDKIPQDIVYFSTEDTPLSECGNHLDISGSMKDKLKTAVETATVFYESLAHPLGVGTGRQGYLYAVMA
jgi:hypothetical protein